MSCVVVLEEEVLSAQDISKRAGNGVRKEFGLALAVVEPVNCGGLTCPAALRARRSRPISWPAQSTRRRPC
ncbi:MAG: hypothetical protein ACXVUE_20305 [Solirubrobacteraceae bacterium]